VSNLSDAALEVLRSPTIGFYVGALVKCSAATKDELRAAGMVEYDHDGIARLTERGLELSRHLRS